MQTGPLRILKMERMRAALMAEDERLDIITYETLLLRYVREMRDLIFLMREGNNGCYISLPPECQKKKTKKWQLFTFFLHFPLPRIKKKIFCMYVVIAMD